MVFVSNNHDCYRQTIAYLCQFCYPPPPGACLMLPFNQCVSLPVLLNPGGVYCSPLSNAYLCPSWGAVYCCSLTSAYLCLSCLPGGGDVYYCPLTNAYLCPSVFRMGPKCSLHHVTKQPKCGI